MQRSSSSFEQGDIAVAAILYSQQVGLKRRPVLVISNTKYNRASEEVVVLSISSAAPKTEYELKLANADLAEGELKMDSKILVDFPTTIEKSLLPQAIGKISEQKLREVKRKMMELYGL